MELILKLPENKPPFVGIGYDYNTELRAAMNTQADLVHDHSDKIFTICIMPSTSYCRVILTNNHNSDFRIYEAVKFNLHNLKAFRHFTMSNKQFNFGHVFIKFNKHELATTLSQNKRFVLKADTFRLIEF